MTDTVHVALIVSAGPMFIGLLNIFHQVMVARRVIVMGENIKRVEQQTNHIKDALVASTALASHAAGVKDEKIRVALEAKVPINTVIAGPHESGGL